MATASKIIRNFYRDSVSLMQLSSRLAKLPGIVQASAVMASEANLALLREARLLDEVTDAGPNDLLITLEGQSEAAIAGAFSEAQAAFDQKPATTGEGPKREAPRSLEMGLELEPSSNLALISTPGDYAASEALKALHLGLNVMIFSDNVSVEDEVALKRYARRRGLLVMGPDCGTAILNGIPLGFANVIRRGAIGVVAASGTGLQQVACLIDRLGAGVSQAVGAGGHDLSREVGGITMLQSIEAMAADEATEVIVLISKPPAADVAMRVLERARAAGKPVVVCFLGVDPKTVEGDNLTAANTLEDAAYFAAAIANVSNAEARTAETAGQRAKIQSGVRNTYAASIAAARSASRLRFFSAMCFRRSIPTRRSAGPSGSRTSGRAGRIRSSISGTTCSRAAARIR